MRRSADMRGEVVRRREVTVRVSHAGSRGDSSCVLPRMISFGATSDSIRSFVRLLNNTLTAKVQIQGMFQEYATGHLSFQSAAAQYSQFAAQAVQQYKIKNKIS